jgi:hypothetical protein
MLTALAPAAAGFALAAAGCGGDSGSSATTTDAHAGHTATPAPVTTPTAKPTPKPQVKTFTIVVEQAQPKGGIKTYTVKKGDRVAIVVRTDLGEAVHLHGYDIEKPVKAGRPTRIVFSATTPGRFVIELHNMDTVLGNLQVEP